MTAVQKRTFSIPVEQAEYVDSLVASGNYASEDEVVIAGLEALQDRGEDIERWLREEVVPIAAAMDADPSRGLSIEEVDADIKALHREHMRTGRR